jgi:AAA domain
VTALSPEQQLAELGIERPLVRGQTREPQVVSVCLTRGAPSKQRFHLRRFNEIILSTAPAYLVKGLLPAAGLVVIWGPPKCGKSFWTTDVLLHVSLGWPYRGRRVRKGAVVYLALEGDSGFRARAEAWRQRHLAGTAEDPLFFEVATRVNLVADHTELINCILAQLPADLKPVVVAIDTLNRSMPGSESNDQDMAKYISAADAIREVFSCCVIVIHHCGLEGTRPRGHTSLSGAADAQISVRRDKSDHIVVEVEHMKDGPEGDAVISRLKQVEVGYDDEGDPITSCIVECVEGASMPAKVRLTGAAKKSLQALHEAIGEFGEAPTSTQIPTGVRKTVKKANWRQRAYRLGISDSDKPDSMETAFRRAYNTLLKAEKIAVWDEEVWPT